MSKLNRECTLSRFRSYMYSLKIFHLLCPEGSTWSRTAFDCAEWWQSLLMPQWRLELQALPLQAKFWNRGNVFNWSVWSKFENSTACTIFLKTLNQWLDCKNLSPLVCAVIDMFKSYCYSSTRCQQDRALDCNWVRCRSEIRVNW